MNVPVILGAGQSLKATLALPTMAGLSELLKTVMLFTAHTMIQVSYGLVKTMMSATVVSLTTARMLILQQRLSHMLLDVGVQERPKLQVYLALAMVVEDSTHLLI